MAGLRDELDLDVSAALRRIDTVEAALGKAAKSFRVELAHALDVLRKADTTVTVTADTKQVTQAVTHAVDAADTQVDVTADTKAAQKGVRALAGETSQAADQADRLRKNMGGAASIGTAFAAGFVLRRVVNELRGAVDAASDLNESISKNQQVFKESAPDVEAWARTASTSVLLSKQAALEAVSTFGNLFTSLGLARQAASKLSPEVVQLAADLASFNNIAVEDAAQKLQSGLVGEVEPLRSLGVALDENSVKAKAMALGLASANGEVDQAAKVQARWAIILEQTKNAQGDVARTADGFANTQRRVNAELANTRAEVGQRLLPVAQLLQHDLLGILDTFERLPGPIKAMLVVLAGVTVATTAVAALSAAVQTLSARLEQAGVSGEVAATGMRVLGTSLGALAILGVIVTGVQLLTAALGKTRDSVDDLARATDRELVAEFRDLQRTIGQLAGPSGFSDMSQSADFYAEVQRELNRELGHFADVARTNIDVARRVRDVLQAQGTDVTELNRVLAEEEASQARANKTTKDGAAVMGDAGQAAAAYAKQVNDIADAINRIVDPTLNLTKAQIGLRTAVADTAAVYTEGRRKGESFQQFQDRLKLSTLDVVKAAEEYVLKQAEAGQIGLDVGSVQQALRASLLGVAEVFPQLRGEIATYITSLTSAATATSVAVSGIGSAVGDLVKFRPNQPGIDEGNRQDKIAQQLADALAGAKSAGAAAGHAAATAAVQEVEKTLRVSAAPGGGLDLGGFIVKGIDVGAATNAAKANNAVLRLLAGMRSVVDQAEKIDPAEQLGILEAVAAMDQATRDLAETRKKFKGNTIEVAIAEGKLRDSQAEVNRKLADAVSATKQVADAQARQKAETDRLKDANDKLTASVKAGRDALKSGLDAYNSAISAVRTLNREQRALRDANKSVAELEQRQAELPGEIAQAETDLAKAKADASAVTAEESLAVVQARKAEAAAEKNLDTLRAGSTATNEQLVKLTLQLRAAEEQLTAAKEDAAGRTDEVIAAEAELADARRTLVPSVVLAAEAKLSTAKAKAAANETKFALAVISAQEARDAAAKALTDAQAGSTASAIDLEEATLQVATAQDTLAKAIADSTAPTQEVTDAQSKLKDLQKEQTEIVDKLADAIDAATDAQLALVDSQRRLIEGGEALVGVTPGVRDFFLEIAKQALGAGKPLQDLIALLDEATRKSKAGFAGSPLATIGGPVIGGPGVIDPATGRVAITGPNGEPGIGAGQLGSTPGVISTTDMFGMEHLFFNGKELSKRFQPGVGDVFFVPNTSGGGVSAAGDGGGGTTVNVEINPKAAIYDPQQTVQTLQTLEWLF